MEPHNFLNTEKSWCVFLAAEGQGPTDMRRVFSTRFGKSAPACQSIQRWSRQHFDRKAHAHCSDNECSQMAAEQNDKTENLFNQNPIVSLRYAVAGTNVSSGTVWNFLGKELKSFPYRLQSWGQTFRCLYKQNKVRFSETCHRELHNYAKYLLHIVSTDDCHFSLSRLENKRNCGVWGREHLQTVRESQQSTPYVMDWCAISESEVIGTYFFDNGSVIWESYRRMVRYFAFPRPCKFPQLIISRQESAPPHFASLFRQYFDMKLSN